MSSDVSTQVESGESAVEGGSRDERLAGWLGAWLGVGFAICFATGLLSHIAQEPASWGWPARPAGLYRITQGLHVGLGISLIPVLLAKLWVVAPKFWKRPSLRDPVDLIERALLLPLVAGGLFLVVSGTFNVARVYPWGFFFPTAHYWVAWIAIGALCIHFAVKLPLMVEWRTRVADAAKRMSRRRFLGGVGATSGLLTVATLGQTVRPLSRLSVFAQRKPGVGPQGLPVNKSAASAGVLDAIADPDYALRLVRGGEEWSWTVDELTAMAQRTADLPLACVEGWSTSATWTGISVRSLLDSVGIGPVERVVVTSLQTRGLYGRSELNAAQADDLDTLLALRLNGEALHADHGAPVRLIGPNRPGVEQTKWVASLEVVE